MRLLMKASRARSGSALSAHFESDDVPTRSDEQRLTVCDERSVWPLIAGRVGPFARPVRPHSSEQTPQGPHHVVVAPRALACWCLL
jgi:hypothetical protein